MKVPKEDLLAAHKNEDKVAKVCCWYATNIIEIIEPLFQDFATQEMKQREIRIRNIIDLQENKDSAEKKLALAACTLETNPSLIPGDLNGIPQKFKAFKAEMKNCGFANDYGIRQYKCAIIVFIGNQIKLAAPNLHDPSRFQFTDSTSSESIKSKLDFALSMYKLTEPLIRQFIIYG